MGANIDGIQFNALNYAPVRREDIKEELIAVHQVEGIFDNCENEIEKQSEWSIIMTIFTSFTARVNCH